MSEIIKLNQFDISKLNYSKPIHQQNVYYGSIDYNETPCYIQTPKIVIDDIKVDNKQTYIIVKLDPTDFSLYDYFVKLDDHNVSSTYTSSNNWFNKELPMDVLEGMYRRITQPFKKGDIPTLTFKIPIQKQKVQCKIYDQSNTTLHFDQLSKGDMIACIIHIKGLKFLKKDYYCDLYISQIKLCKHMEYIIPNQCLIEGDDEETSLFDYEILDEEVILKSKEIIHLEQTMSTIQQNIDNQQQELLCLQQKIDNLK